MTLEVFPAMDGLEFNIKRRAEFKTSVFEATSGKESRISLRQYPKTTFSLSFGFLVNDEEDQQMVDFLAFILRHLGMGKAFLFDDPVDNQVSQCLVGTGNGSQYQWQLSRNLGGFIEPVASINRVVNPLDELSVSPYIYLDGVLKTEGLDYTLTDAGLLSFTGALTSGVVITWSGNFYYKVRFTQDGYDIEQIVQDVFEAREIEFIGSPGDLV
jgi:uncharacterized protein (TIGR02217 family)